MENNPKSVKLWHLRIWVSCLLLVLGNAKLEATILSQATAPLTATVKGKNVNVRQAPDLNAKVITQLQDGYPVTILQKLETKVTIGSQSDYWYEVSGAFGRGWMFGAFLTIETIDKGKNVQIDQTVLCAEISNFEECSQLIEREWMFHYPSFVQRTGEKLLLKTDDGNWKTYTNVTDVGEEAYIGYNLTAVFETPRAYFVDKQHYEGGASILIVRKNGAEYDVLGKPIFSPSSTKFACFNIDLEAAYDPTGIEIWSWNNGNCIREFDLRDGTDGEDRRWGPTGIQWVSETTIRVSRVAVNEETGDLYSVPPLLYEFAKGKWQAVRN